MTHRSAGAVTALLALLVGLVVAASAVSGAVAEEKTLAIPSLRVDALVQADGTMSVTEEVVYDFRGGPFTVGIRTFATDLDQVESFSAADPDGPVEVVPPSESPSGQWEWNLREPTADRVVPFTLTYLVRDAVEVGADVGDLYWQFLGTDRPDVGELEIVVRYVASVPPFRPGTADTDASVLRGFVHGPTGGVVTVETSLVRARATDVRGDRFVEVRAVAPSTAFTVQRSGVELLPAILAEERRFAERGDGDGGVDDERRNLAWVLTPIVMALGALGMGVLWFRSGRELTSTEVLGDYWREPLDDPPAVVAATLARGTVDPSRSVASTLVDLAQRGYIRIVGEQQERLGPDTVEHTYHRTDEPLGPEVLDYERRLLAMVFRGSRSTAASELQEWATHHQKEAKEALDGVTAGVRQVYDGRGYETNARGRALVLLVGVCAAVALASLVVRLYTGNGFGWFGVAAAALLFMAGLRLLSNRTRAGVEAAAKAEGLKQYLRDFSRLEDAPVGHLILWERYLVYAVALGVSADLVRGMAVKVPEVLDDPAFGVWYVGAAGHRFDGLDAMRASSAAMVTAATPNTSGGGGGFSAGGGGGGGGGGGFGAR